MSEPTDPFDDSEMQRIVGEVMSGQVNDAVAAAHVELEHAVGAIAALTTRLLELVPRAAVVNFVTSLAVGTVITGVYESGHDG